MVDDWCRLGLRVCRMPVAGGGLREQVLGDLGLPTFVGHGYSTGDEPGSISVALMSPEYPEYWLSTCCLHTDRLGPARAHRGAARY
jgi:hypothetical protein